MMRKCKIAVLSSVLCFCIGVFTGRESQPKGGGALSSFLRYRDAPEEIDTNVVDDTSTQYNDDKESVIFFHVHIMKTAGSSLNRYLARRYHAVCGHKGYSSDQPFHLGEPRMNEPGGYGLDRVKFSDMEERGWHNCRLISHESDSCYTTRIMKELKDEGFKVHTLVPCRDPVSHCISKLSHEHFEVKKILNDAALCDVVNTACSQIQSDRFSEEILNVADESSFFWYTNFSRVDELISSYVPGRAFQLPEADRKFEMNKPFPDDVVNTLIQKCGRKMHDFFMKKPYYQQCSLHMPQVDQVPQ